MQLLADLLKSILTAASGESSYPKNNDARMAVPPMDGENSGKIMHPDQMQTQMQKPPPGTISNDAGALVDFNFNSNPFKKIIDNLPGGGQGTMTGMMKMLFGSDMKQEKALDRSGVTPRMGGSGDPKHTPGTGQDAVLNPTPMAKQRQKMMEMVPPATPSLPDYSMPTALDPQSIEELRQSLLSQTGQMDPNNPNGLSGRMNSPYYSNDKYNQMSEAQQQHDSLRGFDGTRAAKLKGRTSNAQ